MVPRERRSLSGNNTPGNRAFRKPARRNSDSLRGTDPRSPGARRPLAAVLRWRSKTAAPCSVPGSALVPSAGDCVSRSRTWI
jgi:hypothetical protein